MAITIISIFRVINQDDMFAFSAAKPILEFIIIAIIPQIDDRINIGLFLLYFIVFFIKSWHSFK